MVSYKASHKLRPFSVLLCIPIWVLIMCDLSKRALWQRPAGRNLATKSVNFCGRSISVMLRRNFYIPHNLTTWGRRLYFPSEGRPATDFYSPKTHRARPGLNPRILGTMAITITFRPREWQCYRLLSYQVEHSVRWHRGKKKKERKKEKTKLQNLKKKLTVYSTVFNAQCRPRLCCSSTVLTYCLSCSVWTHSTLTY
jgi:hypothetical protein